MDVDVRYGFTPVATIPRAGQIVELGETQYGRITERQVERAGDGYRYTLVVEPADPPETVWYDLAHEPTDC